MAQIIEAARRVVPERTKNNLKRIAAPAVAHNLDALGIVYNTDKGPRGHNYTAVYGDVLRSRRRLIHRVLELGIGGDADPDAGGNSLRMWRRYFPKASIVGIDLHPKSIHIPGVTIEQCDQSDPDALRSLAERHGPFDLVIDDGSHVNSHVLTSFEALYGHVVDGGLYVIEDTHTAYEADGYGGGPPGTPGTSVDLAKRLLDRIHVGEGVAEVRVHRGLILIFKGKPITV